MAVVFPYVKNPAWADGSGGATPISAAKLNIYEDGIFNAHQQPAVRAYHNAAQSIPASTETTLAFNSERFDQAGGAASTMHDSVTLNSRLTCRYAGVYQITANVEFPGSAAASLRSLLLRQNGTTYIAKQEEISAASNPHALSVSTLYSLAVNDYVEVRVYHAAAGALNVNATANYSPEFMMVRVG